ncbi:MAG: DNA gyrase inhibitor YacG [Planctomycetota bacterium]|nr:DNA gyrase inhibitor YacG [Planctomycetota bacterium]
MNCPICKKHVFSRDDPVAPNRFFPFCGERCQLIDLGRWLDGKYQFPVEEPLDDGPENDAAGAESLD